MNPADLPTLFAVPLTRLGLPYAVTGGVAAIIYGEPRFTRDIDILLRLEPHAAERLLAAFPPGEFYAPPLEALLAEAARPAHGHFNLLHLDTGFRADVYLTTDDPLERWALETSRHEHLETGSVAVARAEYVIIRKLEYYRDGGSERHLMDIRSMLEVSSDTIDMAVCESWVARRSLVEQWRQVRRDSS